MGVGILFDLDGTLLDTLTDLYNGVNYALEQFSLPARTRAEVRQMVGGGTLNLVQQSMPGLPGDPDLEQIHKVYLENYNTHCQDNTCPYPGILEQLAYLQKKYPVAVVSNKPDGSTKALCARFFPGVYALGQRPDIPKKPAPDMLYSAMEALGVDRCIYVGDSETDIQVAQNAGMPCLSVLWGFRDLDQLEQVGGKHFCPSTDQLGKMIEELIETGN